MKAIHIFSINSGGAAIAARRIAKSIEIASGGKVENVFLSLYNDKKNNDVVSFFSNSISSFIGKAGRKVSEVLFEPSTKNYPGPFTLGKYGVANNKKLKNILSDIDIIHIHWVNRGFFSINQLAELSKLDIPIVWTMHDMWAFTGGCHYDGECGEYKERCYNCPCIKKGKNVFFVEQEKKKKIFQKNIFYFIGCSEWITNCAKNSYILRDQDNIECIANPISNSFFEEVDKMKIRDKYKIDSTERIILFGAMSSDDERKGGKLIKKIFSEIKKRKYQVFAFGNCSEEFRRENKDIRFLGSIANIEEMHEIFSMSDVFIAPSIQENLANTVMESLASGTPVVAFDIGGMSDMIIDNINGKLVKPFDIESFISSIDYIIEHRFRSKNVKESIKGKFSYDKIGEKYYNVYQRAINR